MGFQGITGKSGGGGRRNGDAGEGEARTIDSLTGLEAAWVPRMARQVGTCSVSRAPDWFPALPPVVKIQVNILNMYSISNFVQYYIVFNRLDFLVRIVLVQIFLSNIQNIGIATCGDGKGRAREGHLSSPKQTDIRHVIHVLRQAKRYMIIFYILYQKTTQKKEIF